MEHLIAVAVPSRLTPRSWRLAAELAGVFVILLVASWVGIATAFPRINRETLWPTQAVLLALVLLAPRDRTRWYLLTLLPVSLCLILQYHLWWSLLLVIFGTGYIQVAVEAAAIRRFSSEPGRFRTLRDVMVFILFAGLIGPLIKTLLAFCCSYLVGGNVRAYFVIAQSWFLSESAAHLILCPPILIALSPGWRRRWEQTTWWRVAEAAVLIGMLLVASMIAFGGIDEPQEGMPARLYLPLPFMLWAAIRFGTGGVAAGMLALAVVAIGQGLRRVGPFGNANEVWEDVLSLQVFLLALSMPLLLLAALMQERRAAERALRESEARFRDLIENLPVGVLVQDADGRIRFCNAHGVRMFGTTQPEVNGRLITDWDAIGDDGSVYPPAARPTAVAVRTRQPVTGALLGVLTPRVPERVWLSVNSLPRLDEAGRVREVFCTFNDVTAQRQATRAVRERDQLLQAVLGSVSATMVVLDREGRITYASRSWDEAAARGGVVSPSPTVSVGANYLQVCRRAAKDEPAAAEALEAIEAVITGRLPGARVEYACDIPEQGRRWFLMQVDPMPAELGGAVVSHVDITARRDAEHALRESEAQLKLAVEAAGLGTWQRNVRTGVATWSAAKEAIFGLPPGGFDGSREQFLSLVHPEDRDGVTADTTRAFRECSSYDMEYRIVRPDGQVRWVVGRGQAVAGDDGRAERMMGVVMDITERRRWAEELRASEQRYRGVVESQTDLVCRYLPDTTLTFVNEAYCRYFGHTRQELIGRPYLELVPEARRDEEIRSLQRLLDNPRQSLIQEQQTVAAGGEARWQQWVDHAILDGEGRVIELQGIGRDITERKLAEEALRQSNARLRLALDAGGICTWEADATTGRVVWSTDLDEMFGLKADQFPGTREAFFEMVHPEDREREMKAVEQALVTGGTEENEYRIVRPDGEVRWIAERGQAVAGEDGRFTRIIGVVTDVTDRRAGQETLLNALREVSTLRDRLQAENTYLHEELSATSEGIGEIVCRSPAMRATLAQVQRVAPTDTTVLILGETGTGKEVLARAIHRLGSRADRPLVRVNVAALPTNLIESELFGHERGAFTGATARRVGRFEIADGGTLFLDEIGELPLELQPKLLRVLQEGEFERLGSSKTIKVNVRVIAATNRNLADSVRKGTFRADLYYRLNVFPVNVPPLRERPEDIEPLAVTFLAEAGRRLGRRFAAIPESVLDILRKHGWPGNVRELQNVIERAAVTTRGRVLELPEKLEPVPVAGENGDAAAAAIDSPAVHMPANPLPHLTLVDHEREHILAALKRARGRVEGAAGAAALLGINASTLRSRMKKLGIKRSSVD